MPSAIERDIDSAQQWKRLIEFDEGSSQPQIPGGFEPEEEEPTFPAGMFPQEEEELQYADPQEQDSSHSEHAEQHHTTLALRDLPVQDLLNHLMETLVLQKLLHLAFLQNILLSTKWNKIYPP